MKKLQTDKGKYDPMTGSFNFAVPDVKTIVWHAKKVCEMCEGNPRIVTKYKKSILDMKGNIYLLKNWISDTLELNRQLCYIMSDINNSNDLFECSNTCNLLN